MCVTVCDPINPVVNPIPVLYSRHIRAKIFLTYFLYSAFTGRFKHAYIGFASHEIAYTMYDLPWFMELMDIMFKAW
jgi:hypothetical protein